MMKRTYLVHGFNVSDKGASTVGTLIPYLQPECPVIFNHSYRRFGLFQTLWCNHWVAKRLVTRMRTEIWANDTAYAVGHSNGCAILLRALQQGAEFETILLINPALNINTKFPPNVKRIIVVHTRHDKAVWAARFFDSIPIVELIVPDAWGAMGRVGYQGDDPRVLNIDLTNMLDDHNAFFEAYNLAHVNRLPEVLYGLDNNVSLIS